MKMADVAIREVGEGLGWVLEDRIHEARPELGVAEKDAYIFSNIAVPLEVTHDVGDTALILHSRN